MYNQVTMGVLQCKDNRVVPCDSERKEEYLLP